MKRIVKMSEPQSLVQHRLKKFSDDEKYKPYCQIVIYYLNKKLSRYK